jgi:hypothetical protein
MAGIVPPRFQESNLSRDTKPWGREVEDRIKALEKSASRTGASELNTNKAQNSSIDLVSKNIVDLDQRMQEAIDNLEINVSQLVGDLDQSRVTGTWDKSVSTVSSLYGATVTGTDVYALSLTTNITATRVALWGRTSDGYIATAVSSEKAKTNIRPVEWSDEKLEAIVGMSLVYYNWIAAVEEAKTRRSLSKGDPDYMRDFPVHLEIGFIAERMHEAGLWEFVNYLHDEKDQLVLVDGEPVPLAIHYVNWSLALHAVTQRLWRDRKKDRTDIDRALKALGLEQTG